MPSFDPSRARRGLDRLVGQLDACTNVLDESTLRQFLIETDPTPDEIDPHIKPKAASPHRRCVARREHYELLVLTWYPSQGITAHDHAGSLCGMKVLRGSLTKQLFEPGPDGQVRETNIRTFGPGEITIDRGDVICAVGNAAESVDVLVAVHIYSPPLSEMRRYAVARNPPASVFLRRAASRARVVAIIGGGFTGAMTLANLLRFGNTTNAPLHVVMIDRQAAIGEGVAYRTDDERHLLNVPASRMSAWPDRPDDFLNFARSNDRTVQPGDFLPRKIYGRYIRNTLLELAESAGDHLSIELLRDDAIQLSRSAPSGWKISTAAGCTIHADVTILALGHRPPDDPLAGRWSGPRTRFVSDPWAAMVLNQIEPDERVMLLGSGLTAVDAILSLDHADRKTPIIAVSRRGLLPLPHSSQPQPAADLSKLIASWLDPTRPLTTRLLVSTLRRLVASLGQDGIDWRQVIDGLRPAIALIWNRLGTAERSRFLSRVRPFWEIHRHRMPIFVFDKLDQLRRQQALEVVAGQLSSAVADASGVDVTLIRRDGRTKETMRVSWVINCTGPGVQSRHSTHPILRHLIDSGTLCEDPLGLGLLTNAVGRAINASGEPVDTLLMAGTLRKSTLWESTAVPELRQQAQAIAQTVLAAHL